MSLEDVPHPKPWFFDSNQTAPLFVGRKNELKRVMYNLKKNNIESSIIKLANIPGIGKTELVRQFFRTYGWKNEILCIEFDFKHFITLFGSNNSNYQSYKICRDYITPQFEWFFNNVQKSETKLEEYYLFLEEIGDEPNLDFLVFLNRLFNKPFLNSVPIVFFWDEAQSSYGVGQDLVLTEDNKQIALRWIQKTPSPNHYPEHSSPFYETVVTYYQGLFRSMCKLIAAFGKPGLRLAIISGTNYSFLQQVDHLGSPLRGRSVDLRLDPLTGEDVEKWFLSYISKPAEEHSSRTNWEVLLSKISFYSGGIPRFVEYFIGSLIELEDIYNFSVLDESFKNLFPKLKKILETTLHPYVEDRLATLAQDCGLTQTKELFSALGKLSMSKEFFSELDIEGILSQIQWTRKKVTLDDLIEIGLFLRSNGLTSDASSGNLKLVSPYQMDVIRKKYVDGVWKEEMGCQLVKFI